MSGDNAQASGETKKSEKVGTQEDFMGRFWATAKKMLDDVLTLEVATYTTTGKGEGDIILTVEADKGGSQSSSGSTIQSKDYHATLQAYTKIKLDADTLALLPVSEEYVLRKEIYDIHKEHVQLAQKTRQEMVAAILNAAASLGGFLKPGT